MNNYCILNNKQKGFTLIELLIVIAIVSILLGIALPNMQTIITKTKVAARVNQLVGILMLARKSAVTRNMVVTLCPSSDGLSCSRDWAQGQILFSDANHNHQVDDEDELIRILPKLPKTHKLTWRAFQNKNYLQYSPTGFTRHQNGTFRYCVEGNDLSFNRALIITVSGRVRASYDNDGDGIHEDSKGKPVVCR